MRWYAQKYYIFPQSQIAVLRFSVTNWKLGFEPWPKFQSSTLPAPANAFHDDATDAMLSCLHHFAI
jgi:hypothetical protein